MVKKNFFLKLALSILALAGSIYLNVAHGQNPEPTKKFTNQEIVDMLNNSLDVNGAVSIYDLNNVFVGQKCNFLAQNGDTVSFTAKHGSTFWWFGVAALEYQYKHPENPIIKPGQPVLNPDPKKTDDGALQPPVVAEKNAGVPMWLLPLLALIGLAVLIYAFNKKRKQEENSNPVTSGPAMHEGGTTDENAGNHLREIAQQSSGGIAPLSITNLTKGMLSGKRLIVGYRPAESYTRLQRIWVKLMGRKIVNGMELRTKTFLTPVPAYRGLATFPNNIQEFIYDLAPCGNYARRGEGLGGGHDVQFVADAQQPAILAQTQIQEPASTDRSVQTVAQQQDIARADQQLSVNNAYTALQLLMATVKNSEGKDNVKVELTSPNFNFKYESSKGIVATNHVAATPEEKKAETAAAN